MSGTRGRKGDVDDDDDDEEEEDDGDVDDGCDSDHGIYDVTGMIWIDNYHLTYYYYTILTH